MTNENRRRPREVFHWDLGLLDQWAARQFVTCSVCGKRLNPAEPEAICHALRHDKSPEMQSKVEQMLSIHRNWERLPDAVRQEYLARAVLNLAKDDRKFEQLQLAGVVTKV